MIYLPNRLVNYSVILSFLLFSCKESPTETENSNKKNLHLETLSVPEVKISVLGSGSFQKQILSNGVVSAQKKIRLGFGESGKVRSISVRNGHKVKKGEVLAELENSLLQNELEQASINFEKAKYNLRELIISYGLNDSLDLISESQLKVLQIKSGYLEAENTLKLARIRYDYTVLKSKFEGVIANLELKEGDFISSEQVFCTVINGNVMEANFFVLENDLPFINNGQSVDVAPFSLPDKKYKGIINEINPSISKNGQVMVKALIRETDRYLFDGMNVKITINSPVANSVKVPKGAVVKRSEKDIIFTYDEGRAKWNYIKINDVNSSYYLIEGNLKSGDTVIVEGNYNLNHDTEVVIKKQD